MRCSTVVGSLKSTRKLFTEIEGEQFFQSEIVIEGSAYPIVGSEFIMKSLEGKVEVEYYLRTEVVNDKLFTYINALTVRKVDESTPDLNEIIIYGQVVKCRPLTVKNETGQNVISFTVKSRSHDKNRNFSHCVAYNANARRLNELKTSDTIRFKGHLKINRCIEVVVDNVQEIYTVKKDNQTIANG